jgi:hypothetical protein
MDIDTNTLAEQLINGRNADGGWGYYRGKASRLEPTAWAILALAEHTRTHGDTRVLSSWPSVDGLLLEHAGGSPNYGFQGLALLVLNALDAEHVSGNSRLVAGLQKVKGVALPNGNANPTQDNTLQAWSWMADTFSWVEPTGWCLLALKKHRLRASREVDAARVDVAERLLINRTCASGGWNYGNADTLGQDLRAYVPTTAIGLLAMQDRRDHEAIRRSLAYLEAEGTTESSGSALALAMIALRTLGRDSTAVEAQLQKQIEMTLELGNHASIAAALYALSASANDRPTTNDQRPTTTYAAFAL